MLTHGTGARGIPFAHYSCEQLSMEGSTKLGALHLASAENDALLDEEINRREALEYDELEEDSSDEESDEEDASEEDEEGEDAE